MSRVPGVVVAPMAAGHAEQVLAIYRAGIDEGDATFETGPPDWGSFDAAKLPGHRFVALGADGAVLGWVAAAGFRTGARMRASSSTPSMSTPPRGAAGLLPPC